MPYDLVQLNAANWLKKGFGSVGRARVTEKVTYYIIEAQVEGAPAHDPEYVVSVKQAFERFVEGGWGPLAVPAVDVKVLAGDQQNGKAPSQVIVMPGRV